ncbi:MDR family MFS transporter [Heyndrickxia ginsengihumi]|uniref:MFS transporter n=1 Tax=Heyndrickxia ginsengihumi TaxID=363870 RepID=A0A0A6VH39_9BACI|nr:MFS transporter [Heyndrickxia ginsengihumi]KHD85944.1 multidrug MFS transporter [Heyndrickxia ginsengihumi]MBE6185503.1 MFS transporter [Bacillus sp. (in: firmicutes)]NEY21004.1 MFS transporter [Heyndrickxia ginsengihumi]
MPRTVWLLVIGMAVNITGSSFLWPLNSIYIHDHLGKSLSIAGFVLMLNSFASVIGSLIGGYLHDKIGGYRSVLLGIAITVCALIGLTLRHEWPYYVVFLGIVGLGSGIIGPAMYAMTAAAWKNGGRKAFNAIYVAQNVGVAVGSGLGGAIASYSFDFIFLANLCMFLLFMVIALFGYKNISEKQSVHSNRIKASKPVYNRSHIMALTILCTAYLLAWISYVQWQATISSYTQVLHITLNQYSLLWTLNGAIIVLGQPLLIPMLKKYLTSVKLQILVGIVIFTISFICASFADRFSGFIAAMVILTIGEMLVWPAVPTIASQLAPSGRDGFYQGVVNSVATAGRMIGPVVGGVLVDAFGMKMLFVVLIVLLMISFIFASLYNRPLQKSEKQAATTRN